MSYDYNFVTSRFLSKCFQTTAASDFENPRIIKWSDAVTHLSARDIKVTGLSRATRNSLLCDPTD